MKLTLIKLSARFKRWIYLLFYGMWRGYRGQEVYNGWNNIIEISAVKTHYDRIKDYSFSETVKIFWKAKNPYDRVIIE